LSRILNGVDRSSSFQDRIFLTEIRMSTSTVTPPKTVEASGQPRATAPKATSNSGAFHILANAGGAILILGLGVAGFLIFGRKPDVPTDTSLSSAASIAPLVVTADVQAWDRPFDLEINGEAATWRMLTVGAEVTGRIEEKPEWTRSGTFVNKGDVLFEIDSANYQLERDRLLARVEQAQEELNAIEVDLQNVSALLELAKEDNKLQNQHLERVRVLFQRKATSESEMDSAIQQELTSRNSVQTLENQVKSLEQQKKTKKASEKLAQAELQRTLKDLERCTIYSPVTGRIVDDMHEKGDYIKPGDVLVHISDSSRMEVKLSLKADELAWVWQQGLSMNPPSIATSESAAIATESADGKKQDPFKIPNVPCRVSFEFEGVETIWDGTLDRYEGTGIDRETRMFPCRVIVDEPEKPTVNFRGRSSAVTPPTLLSGMYVTVRIPITSPVPLFQVPAEALRPGEQLWIVRDQKLKIVPVSLVKVDGESALIRADGGSLRVGDQVVVSPLASASDGMPVSTSIATSPANVEEVLP